MGRHARDASMLSAHARAMGSKARCTQQVWVTSEAATRRRCEAVDSALQSVRGRRGISRACAHSDRCKPTKEGGAGERGTCVRRHGRETNIWWKESAQGLRFTLSSQRRFGWPPAHWWSFSNLAPPSSDHECDAKASTCPSVASTVFACIAGSGLLCTSSSRVSDVSGSARKRPQALARVAAQRASLPAVRAPQRLP